MDRYPDHPTKQAFLLQLQALLLDSSGVLAALSAASPKIRLAAAKVLLALLPSVEGDVPQEIPRALATLLTDPHSEMKPVALKLFAQFFLRRPAAWEAVGAKGVKVARRVLGMVESGDPRLLESLLSFVACIPQEPRFVPLLTSDVLASLNSVIVGGPSTTSLRTWVEVALFLLTKRADMLFAEMPALLAGVWAPVSVVENDASVECLVWLVVEIHKRGVEYALLSIWPELSPLALSVRRRVLERVQVTARNEGCTDLADEAADRVAHLLVVEEARMTDFTEDLLSRPLTSATVASFVDRLHFLYRETVGFERQSQIVRSMEAADLREESQSKLVRALLQAVSPRLALRHSSSLLELAMLATVHPVEAVSPFLEMVSAQQSLPVKGFLKVALELGVEAVSALLSTVESIQFPAVSSRNALYVAFCGSLLRDIALTPKELLQYLVPLIMDGPLELPEADVLSTVTSAVHRMVGSTMLEKVLSRLTLSDPDRLWIQQLLTSLLLQGNRNQVKPMGRVLKASTDSCTLWAGCCPLGLEGASVETLCLWAAIGAVGVLHSDLPNTDDVGRAFSVVLALHSHLSARQQLLGSSPFLCVVEAMAEHYLLCRSFKVDFTGLTSEQWEWMTSLFGSACLASALAIHGVCVPEAAKTNSYLLLEHQLRSGEGEVVLDDCWSLKVVDLSRVSSDELESIPLAEELLSIAEATGNLDALVALNWGFKTMLDAGTLAFPLGVRWMKAVFSRLEPTIGVCEVCVTSLNALTMVATGQINLTPDDIFTLLQLLDFTVDVPLLTAAIAECIRRQNVWSTEGPVVNSRCPARFSGLLLDFEQAGREDDSLPRPVAEETGIADSELAPLMLGAFLSEEVLHSLVETTDSLSTAVVAGEISKGPEMLRLLLVWLALLHQVGAPECAGARAVLDFVPSEQDPGVLADLKTKTHELTTALGIGNVTRLSAGTCIQRVMQLAFVASQWQPEEGVVDTWALDLVPRSSAQPSERVRVRQLLLAPFIEISRMLSTDKRPKKWSSEPAEDALTFFYAEGTAFRHHFGFADLSLVSPTAAELLFVLCQSFPRAIRRLHAAANMTASRVLEAAFRSNLGPRLIRAEVNEARAACDSPNTDLGALSVRFDQHGRQLCVTVLDDFRGFSCDVKVSFSQLYPLIPPAVDTTTIKGMEAKMTRWRLRLLASLAGKGATSTVFSAISYFILNVRSAVAGIEDCPICYCCLHPQFKTLPRFACKTCKYKFHSECLYKWMRTSNNSTCPLCRSPT